MKGLSEFWDLFLECERRLAKAESADDPVYDELLERLHAVHPGLFLEFSSTPGARELIVTAEGDESLFPLVDTIVEAAPEVPGWTVHALRPRTGFPETSRWESVTVTTSDLVFDPLSREGSDDLGLRVFVPAGTDDTDRATLNHTVIVR